jgi:hypothetical protein
MKIIESSRIFYSLNGNFQFYLFIWQTYIHKLYTTQKYASITNTLAWKKDGWPMIIISQVLGQHLTIWFYFNYDIYFKFIL